MFALEEIEKAIKSSLNVSAKISTCFEKSNEGFKLILQSNKRQELESAYAFFYEYRINYFNCKLSREQAESVVNMARLKVATLSTEE